MSSVLGRVAALVVAIGLVVGALVFRGGRDAALDADGPVAAPVDEIACAAEVVALCRVALDGSGVRSVATDDLADDLIADGATPAVVPAAWADVVDDARARAGRPALERSDVVASTPLLLVAFADRAAVLADTCGTTVAALTWDCVGEQAGRRWDEIGGDVRWGSVVLGHLSPDTATGLQATTGIVAARTGLPFSLAELRDASFTTWFRQLERAVANHTPAGGSHLTAMVTRGPSVANVAVATEAEAAVRSLDTAFGAIVAVAAEPMLAVELVVVGTDRRAVDGVADGLTDSDGRTAFAEAGWRATGIAPAGAPLAELPAVSATPNGGVLTAVRTVWSEVAG